MDLQRTVSVRFFARGQCESVERKHETREESTDKKTQAEVRNGHWIERRKEKSTLAQALVDEKEGRFLRTRWWR